MINLRWDSKDVPAQQLDKFQKRSISHEKQNTYPHTEARIRK